MKRLRILAAGGLLLISGCAHVPPPAAPAPPIHGDAARLQLRNNAASLLADLLNDEKNVNKILIIKHAPDVDALIRLIAAAAGNSEQELQQLTQADPELNLQVLHLPPGEQAAREAVARSKEYDLLFSSGADFEFKLLLTQAEAQNYGWHLARVAADNSSRREEVQTFNRIGDSMKHLYEQTVTMMRSLPAH